MNEDISMSRLKEIKQSRWIDIENEEEYIKESEKYIQEHIPKKAIQHYLPPNMVFLRDEFYSIFLSRLIEKYQEIESYRNVIESYRNGNATGPMDPMWERELRKGEEIGF